MLPGLETTQRAGAVAAATVSMQDLGNGDAQPMTPTSRRGIPLKGGDLRRTLEGRSCLHLVCTALKCFSSQSGVPSQATTSN